MNRRLEVIYDNILIIGIRRCTNSISLVRYRIYKGVSHINTLEGLGIDLIIIIIIINDMTSLHYSNMIPYRSISYILKLSHESHYLCSDTYKKQIKDPPQATKITLSPSQLDLPVIC